VDRRSWLLLLLLASIWGASYMLIKIGLREMSPAMVAFARIALAAAVLLPIAAAQGALGRLRGRLGIIVLVGAIQVAGPFWLIPLGEQEISSALAGILVATTPIFTALLAIRIDHEERSEGLRLVGVAIGVAGVIVLFGLDLGGSGAAVIGGLAVVLASVGYSVGGFLVKHRLSDARPLGVVASVMAASAGLLLVPALVTAPSSAPGLGPLAAVAALGLLGTGAAFVIFYLLIGTVGPARTMVVAYVAPGFAVAYGALLLGEAITVATIIGLALIVGGSWLAAGGVLPGRLRTTQAVAPVPPSHEAAATPDTGAHPALDEDRQGSPPCDEAPGRLPIRRGRAAS
jgi:drug/metabolite transporter (DMT)-like permease